MGQSPNQNCPIRADLAARITAIDLRVDHARPFDLARDLDQVRRIAQSNGMLPAVTVAHALDSALARGEHGPLIHGWLAILHDAIGCDRFDGPTCDAYAAACSVRLAS